MIGPLTPPWRIKGNRYTCASQWALWITVSTEVLTTLGPLPGLVFAVSMTCWIALITVELLRSLRLARQQMHACLAVAEDMSDLPPDLQEWLAMQRARRMLNS